MAKSKKQLELERKLAPSGRKAREAREAMLKDLGDPERFAHHLRVFTQVALLREGLHGCRFPADAFVEAVINAELPEPPEGEDPALFRGRALRGVVVPALANAELLKRCQATIQGALGNVAKREEILALTAAGALASACEQAGVPTEHAFWEILFELSLTEALLSSLFLTRLIQGGQDVDTGAIAQAFAKALNGELGAELDALGIADPDPAKLAERYAELVADRDPHHFQFDAVLHLSLLHVELSATLGREIATQGLTPQIKDAIRERYEAAYEADVTDVLVGEVCTWYHGYLTNMRDDPASLEGKLPRPLEVERTRSLVCYLAYKALPKEENQLLRSVHVQSLARSRVAVSEQEAVFVGKLWANPTDTFGLEEYEKYLIGQGDKTRSRRVRRFRDTLRQRKKQEPGNE